MKGPTLAVSLPRPVAVVEVRNREMLNPQNTLLNLAWEKGKRAIVAWLFFSLLLEIISLQGTSVSLASMGGEWRT